MAKATSTATVSPTAAAVDTLILAAGKAAGTMYTKTLEAAKLARAELDGAESNMAKRIAAVMTAHAGAFTKAGHNVKAIFSDALTLHACAGDTVVIAGPKGSSQTMSASKAVETLAKNPMREAAKDVRAQHGMGRKTTPKVAAPMVPTAPVDATAEKTRETLNNVATLLEDAAFISRLTGLLDAAGFVLAPKAKRANNARTTPKVRVNMADLPVHRISGVADSASPF